MYRLESDEMTRSIQKAWEDIEPQPNERAWNIVAAVIAVLLGIAIFAAMVAGGVL